MNIEIRGNLSTHEPMSRHCSWRTGGPAERYFEPADLDDLIEYLRNVGENEQITWIGLGSNVLIRDGGVNGTVISTTKTLNKFRWLTSNTLYVECGTPCAKVAKEAVRMNVAGGAFLAGIPGSIGGALAMNAGAFGSEIWMLVDNVQLIGRDGTANEEPSANFETSYRYVDLEPDRWFLSAVLRFEKNTEQFGDKEIRALLTRRNETQPTGKASCGSVFKNPPNDFAGRLIENAGLKGTRRGGCCVSDKHANFIVNDKSATAADIEALILDVQQKVSEQFNIKLEPEVRIIGHVPASVSERD